MLPGTDARVEQDDRSCLDRCLASLSDGSLGQRIAEAARLAMARHMIQTVQEIRSAVEAEDSA